MSASTIIGLGAIDAFGLLVQIAEQVAVLQGRTATTPNALDEPIYGAYADLVRTQADGTTATATPCYLANREGDPGEQPVTLTNGIVVTNAYLLYLPYAPDATTDWRVRQVRHATTGEVFAANPLYATKVDHIAPVLTILTLGEVR